MFIISKKILVGVTFVLTAIFLLSGCKVGRFFYRNYADIKDYKFFPYRSAQPAPQPFQFKEVADLSALGDRIKIRQTRGIVGTLNQVLDQNKTVACLIIRNDSIIYEKYFEKYDADDYVTSFSIAKSVTNTLIGIAEQEGKIKNLQQPITDFIPELKAQDPNFEKIQIHHLMNMTSGLRLNEQYLNPFSEGTKIYYGTELRKYLLKLKTEHAPGIKFRYNSYNTELLGLILERATGQTVATYLEKKLWQPLGCEGDARWSLDRKNTGKQIPIEKTYCCLNARARDFARFGRLYLRYGNWDGNQILPRKWFEYVYSNDTTQGKMWDYTYHWLTWSAAHKFYVSPGLYQQFIGVLPEQNTMIVHFSKRNGLLGHEYYQNVCLQILDQMKLGLKAS